MTGPTSTRPARLVVNADDFGLTEGTNRAILDAHHSGIVTSTSLLANGQSFDHAVALARQTPSLGVGVHLTLTEGAPLSPELRAIMPELPLSNQPYARALARGKLPTAAIRAEFDAQIRKVYEAGIRPTHLDGHKYIHLLPGLSAIAADLAHEHNIPVMRVPHRLGDAPLSRPGRLLGLVAIGLMGMLAYRPALRARLHIPDRVVGFADTGHLTREAILRLLVTGTARPGVTELLCHPAYLSAQLQALYERGYVWIAGYAFEAETAAVAEPAIRARLEAAGWALCSYAAAFG